MNVARWTPSPAVEQRAALARRWARLGRRWAVAAWVGTPIVLIAEIILFSGIATSLQALGVVPVIGSTTAYFLFAILRAEEAARRAGEQAMDATLQHEFGIGQGWLVDLLIHRGEAPTGRDRGMLWIDHERLYFAGYRTSFGLSPDQAAGFCRETDSVALLRNKLWLPLREAGMPPLAISFSPAARDLGARRRRTTVTDLCNSVNRWSGRGGPKGGQLPPLEVGPGAPQPIVLLAASGLAIAYWVAAVSTIVGLVLVDSTLLAFLLGLLIVFAGFSLPGVSSPLLGLRAWRDRKRLEAGSGG